VPGAAGGRDWRARWMAGGERTQERQQGGAGLHGPRASKKEIKKSE